MFTNKPKTECERCGTCCMKGGPALHKEDSILFQKGIVNREALITIRRGEPVFFPDQARPKWSKDEIVKIKGKSGQWTCKYYDEKSTSCAIYHQRPLECRLLQCWNTAPLEAVIGKGYISRFDIIPAEEPVIGHIKRHENQCGLEILSRLDIKPTASIDNSLLADLTDLVNRDLEVRSEAVRMLDLTLELELFYFGRPVFKILSEFNLVPREINGKVMLLHA